MNKARRKQLEEIQERLADTKGDLELLRDEEQEYIDNMPESLAGSERATQAENAVSNMDDVITSLEETGSLLEEASARE